MAADASWLATGVVTKVDGNTLFMLGKDNVVYRVDAAGANMVSGDREIRPGTGVRVYGSRTGEKSVRAMRVRVLGTGGLSPSSAGTGPGRDVRIVVEKETVEPIPEAPVGVPGACAIPSLPTTEAGPAPTWQGKGLITRIDYVGRQVTIQTSDGPFTVNIDGATMVRGTVRVSFATLNQGDTLWVAGNEVAPFVVDGRVVRVLRTYTDAQNAVPTLPTSVVGVILDVDYPSRTFKMRGRSTTAVVSCDDNTVIQFQQLKKPFSDLKPGTKVNMSGYGNLNAGYAAQHIQIIAVSP